MSKVFLCAVALLVSGLVLLQGCAGKQGPTGPSGAGLQTVHALSVTPTAASDVIDIPATEVIVNPDCDCGSTVISYVMLSSDPGVMVTIPATLVESDNTTTLYTVAIRTGKVTLGWHNSGSTVPKITEFVITVINKE
jgi:hypothetical protein